MQNTPHVNLLYTPALREERVVDAVAGVVIDPRRFSEERVGDGVGCRGFTIATVMDMVNKIGDQKGAPFGCSTG